MAARRSRSAGVAQPRAQHALAHSPALAAPGLDEPVTVEMRRFSDHAHELAGMAAGVLPEAAAGHVACDVALVLLHGDAISGAARAKRGLPSGVQYPRALESFHLRSP